MNVSLKSISFLFLLLVFSSSSLGSNIGFVNKCKFVFSKPVFYQNVFDRNLRNLKESKFKFDESIKIHEQPEVFLALMSFIVDTNIPSAKPLSLKISSLDQKSKNRLKKSTKRLLMDPKYFQKNARRFLYRLLNNSRGQVGLVDFISMHWKEESLTNARAEAINSALVNSEILYRELVGQTLLPVNTSKEPNTIFKFGVAEPAIVSSVIASVLYALVISDAELLSKSFFLPLWFTALPVYLPRVETLNQYRSSLALSKKENRNLKPGNSNSSLVPRLELARRAYFLAYVSVAAYFFSIGDSFTEVSKQGVLGSQTNIAEASRFVKLSPEERALEKTRDIFRRLKEVQGVSYLESDPIFISEYQRLLEMEQENQKYYEKK